MNENGQSGTAEGAKRHSRRRRRSSRGQGKAGQQGQSQQDQSRAKAAQDKRPQSKGSQGRNAQGKNPQGKNAQAKNSHNKNGSPKNQQKGSQGKGGSAARPGSRPGSRRGSRSGGGRGPQRAASGAARRSPARGFSGREELADLPTSIETSAGGLVLSGLAEAVQPDGSVDLSSIYVALIGRLDRRGRLLWSMPKGHIEPDESQHTTAEREVWEETGIAGEVIADLGTIDYWFISDGVQIHKTVHHHLLRFVDGDLNDEDPEVTEVSWLPVNQLMEKLAYADERRLARIAFDRLPEYAREEARAGRSTPR